MTDSQADWQTGKEADRRAGRQEFRETGRLTGSEEDRQTRVSIKLGLVDWNDKTTTYIHTSVYIRP